VPYACSQKQRGTEAAASTTELAAEVAICVSPVVPAGDRFYTMQHSSLDLFWRPKGESRAAVGARNASSSLPPAWLIFVTSPTELYVAFYLSDAIPRLWLTRVFLAMPLPASLRKSVLSLIIDLPRVITRLLHFTLSISASLAFLNAAPVYFLDGQHALKQFVRMMYPDPRKHTHITNVVLLMGSSLLLVNLGLALFSATL
jgi:membrane-associated protease RseP (regulator of RpoE activity)